MMLAALVLAVLPGPDPIDSRPLDEALRSAYGPAAPGAIVAVMRGGALAFDKSYGLANVEKRHGLEPDMALPVGSVTKPFTAAAIMTLVRDGKLQLDAPLQRFLPELAIAGAVTVDHLLTHTSGIKSFTDLPAWQEAMRQDPSLGVDAARVLSMIAEQPLEFMPGSREAYSNSNYFLLGKIVEQVAGRPYEDYLRVAVLEPAGMSRTSCASPARIAPVLGYRKRGAEFNAEPFLGPAGCRGSGGLAATASDLAQWNRVLSTDVLLPAALRQTMLTPSSLPDGPGSYARGWEIWDHEGHRYLWHGGYTWGFISAVVHDVDDDITVALVSNNVSPVEELDAQYLAKRLALLAAGRGGAEPVAISVAPAVLDRYAGVYTDPGGAQRKVISRGGRLFAQRIPGSRYEVFGETSTRFFFQNSFARLTFTRDASGRVTGMIEDGEGAPVSWQRTGDLPVRTPVAVPAKTLEAYVGEYEIRPGNVLVISREGDTLFGQPTGGQREPFLAAGPADFFIESGDTEFRFLMDADGIARAVLLHEPGWELEARRLR